MTLRQEIPAEMPQTQTFAKAEIATPTTTKPRRLYDLNAAAAEEGSLEREVIQAAQTCVLSRLPWPAETIDIRLAQPVPLDVRQVGLAEGYECTADLRSSGSAVGRVQVRVVAETVHGPNFEVPIVLDVRHFDKVVVSSRALERGHVITASDLYVDRQDVTDLTEYCSDPNEMVGLAMKRSVRALQPLRMNDLDAVARTESSVLVKRRDQVKMVARVGAVSVSAMGEALQDGRLGETIRLRNIETNSNVQARVTRAGEVEISF
jgi:flagella basal body P-ring formation protein FlgA